jgi:DNA-binding transcriptional LysR family regulator
MGIIGMRHTNLQKLDMNLLLVFDGLMEERSVTRTAERLRLTQAGVSHALGRLRLLLKDDLFVRSKGAMQPTARASALAMPVRNALAQLNAALDPHDFDPKTSTQMFRLVASDYFTTVALPKLVERLENEAPKIDLRIVPISINNLQELLANNDIEFAAGTLRSRITAKFSTDCTVSKLFDDDYVCVMRRNHPLAKSNLTRARYLASKHILFSPTGNVEYGIERYLRPIGIRRNIGLILCHYLAAPLILERSDMIMTAPRRIAKFYAGKYAVHLAPLPVAIPSAQFQLAWNSRFTQHPAYKWFRSVVSDVCSKLK